MWMEQADDYHTALLQQGLMFGRNATEVPDRSIRHWIARAILAEIACMHERRAIAVGSQTEGLSMFGKRQSLSIPLAAGWPQFRRRRACFVHNFHKESP